MTSRQATQESRQPRRVRFKLLLWPIVAIAATTLLAVAWVWNTEASQRQEQVLKTITVCLAAGCLTTLWVLIWLLFLSRLRLRTRLAGVAVLVGVGLALAASVKVRGVTGDVMPIVDWRWSRDPGEVSGELPSPAVGTTATSAGGAIRSNHDYPQFLGPRRDGSVRGVRLSRGRFQRPELLWRRPIGAGWSGFAVAGDHAVTQEQRGEDEAISCYDVGSGELRWIHTDRARWDDPLGGPGPRATPTIVEDRVYALGGTGLLNVLDLRSGEKIWSIDVLKDNRAAAPTYGVSASPLLLDQAVVVIAGGPDGRSLVAYHRDDGQRLWSGGEDPAAYSSPVVAELAGRRQILGLSAENVFGHDAETGEPLWSYPWPPTERVSQVVVLPGERLFVSSGYGVGSKLLGVRAGAAGGFNVELIWESQAMKAKFTNVVHRDGFLYGLDDGILACVDAASGERRWKGGRYGHGQIVLVEDLILVLTEKGSVALVEASPAGHSEVARFSAIAGKTWNHPALSGRRLLVRNDREAACYELSAEIERGSPGDSI